MGSALIAVADGDADLAQRCVDDLERHLQMAQRGEEVDLDQLLQQINQRDRRDATRRVGRMRKADDSK